MFAKIFVIVSAAALASPLLDSAQGTGKSGKTLAKAARKPAAIGVDDKADMRRRAVLEQQHGQLRLHH
jgi:hypothetical protein